jgi:hypothetical protein
MLKSPFNSEEGRLPIVRGWPVHRGEPPLSTTCTAPHLGGNGELHGGRARGHPIIRMPSDQDAPSGVGGEAINIEETESQGFALHLV